MGYGFEPEFVGRLPVRVACHQLDQRDLAQILKSSEGNLLEQYRLDFKGYGIDFKITPEAIDEIAGRAHAEKTGARGLMTIFERIFRDFKFELPCTAIKSFEVTTDTLKDPEAALKKLIVANEHLRRGALLEDVQAFAKRFSEEHDIEIKFSEDALDALLEEAVVHDTTIRALCEKKFRDFEHGLKIVSRNSGQQAFTLNADFVRQPDKSLSKLVVASFQALADDNESKPSESDRKE
jgi:ATP-dependent Clp protease ATP-binding subunit ClpX